jgi:hypothetical protein
MTASVTVMFNPRILAATVWLITERPDRPIIPKLRDRFGLSARQAIMAMRLAGVLP